MVRGEDGEGLSELGKRVDRKEEDAETENFS